MLKLLIQCTRLTITDLSLKDKRIYCSFNIVFAARIHHLSTLNKHLPPCNIIDSFAFKYFTTQERDFLIACNTYNNFVSSAINNKDYEISKISTGRELLICIYDNTTKNYILQFKINDVSTFTGLCRRYTNPTEVEKIITDIFSRR